MAELYTELFKQYLSDPHRLEADLSNDVAIDQNRVLELAMRQSAIFMKWTAIRTIAETEYKKHKRYIEDTLWPTYYDWAKQVIEQAGDKATEKAIQVKVYGLNEYKAEQEKLRQYGHLLDMLKGVENSLWQKKDMLKVLVERYKQEELANVPMYIPSHEHVSQPARVESKLTTEELEALASKKIGGR